MKRTYRLTAIILLLTMLLSAFPITVLATDEESTDLAQLEASANPSDAEELCLNEDSAVSIEQGGEEALFSFTPDQTDLYRFSSSTDIDTYGSLYDADMAVLAENDDGEDANFQVEYVLNAGETYYFGAKCTNTEQTGEFSVCLEIIHSYVSKVTEATCTEDGCETYTCEYCGDSYEETISATGHDYAEEGTEATCTEDGTATYACQNCGDSYTETIPALEHDFADGICTRCGEQENPSGPEETLEAEEAEKPEAVEEPEATKGVDQQKEGAEQEKPDNLEETVDTEPGTEKPAESMESEMTEETRDTAEPEQAVVSEELAEDETSTKTGEVDMPEENSNFNKLMY